MQEKSKNTEDRSFRIEVLQLVSLKSRKVHFAQKGKDGIISNSN